jgi:DNA-binding transcriptional regulator YiaG
MQEQHEICASQIVLARAALGLSIRGLSVSTGISMSSLKRYELAAKVPTATKGHLQLLKSFFEARGIEFVGAPDDGPGIRIWRRPD